MGLADRREAEKEAFRIKKFFLLNPTPKKTEMNGYRHAFDPFCANGVFVSITFSDRTRVSGKLLMSCFKSTWGGRDDGALVVHKEISWH